MDSNGIMLAFIVTFPLAISLSTGASSHRPSTPLPRCSLRFNNADIEATLKRQADNLTMPKTILITGSTDGIGLLTAKKLASQGHKILLHGRNKAKLDAAVAEVGGNTEKFLADLSRSEHVQALAQAILDRHNKLDVLINNAGVLKAPHTRTPQGLDIRFMVNTLAPYMLTKSLLPIIPKGGRIVNLSSAAQARVNVQAMAGQVSLDDMTAYAQSKLAITIWTRELAKELREGPIVVAVNPGSLLATKMVREGFGIAGNDLQIGANILCKLATDPQFADASGKYFDNDEGSFGQPNAAALNSEHSRAVMKAIRRSIAALQ